MAASIRINGSPGPLEVPIGVPVTLSNASDLGVLGWDWVLVPYVGSAATLDDPAIAAPQFTPDVEGTYLVRLATWQDVAKTIVDDSDDSAAFVLYVTAPNWRKPGVGERTEVDSDEGWAPVLDEILDDLHVFLGTPVTLQDAYEAGPTIAQTSGVGPIERSSSDAMTLDQLVSSAATVKPVVKVQGTHVGRTGPLVEWLQAAANGFVADIKDGSAVSKLAVFIDGLRGAVSMAFKPTKQTPVGASGFDLSVASGDGGDGDGGTPGGSGGVTSLDAGAGGASGGAGAGAGGLVLIGKTYASSIQSGKTGGVRWAHVGDFEATPPLVDQGGGNYYALWASVAHTAGSASIFVATSSPESAISARPGSLCLVESASASKCGLWFKSAGTGNTGWIQVAWNATYLAFTPNGTISATDVQAAIVEVRNEAEPRVSVSMTFTSGVTDIRPDTSGGPVTFSLPAASTPQRLYVWKTGADANKLTASPDGTDTVNGGGAGVDKDLDGSTSAGPGLFWVFVTSGDGAWMMGH